MAVKELILKHSFNDESLLNNPKKSFFQTVGTAETVASQPGPHFFEEIGERTLGALPRDPAGEKSFFSPDPFSPGWGGSSDFLLSAYLACGLQDQRLMARPPARAGGRSGLLTGGESGKPNGYSLPSPKGYLPTSPARPAGGRAVTGLPV